MERDPLLILFYKLPYYETSTVMPGLVALGRQSNHIAALGVQMPQIMLVAIDDGIALPNLRLVASKDHGNIDAAAKQFNRLGLIGLTAAESEMIIYRQRTVEAQVVLGVVEERQLRVMFEQVPGTRPAKPDRNRLASGVALHGKADAFI